MGFAVLPTIRQALKVLGYVAEIKQSAFNLKWSDIDLGNLTNS